MEKYASARRMTGTEELLSVMGNQEVKTEAKEPRKTHWQQIVMACLCMLAIAAAGKGFLYLGTEISEVQSAVGSAVRDLGSLKAELTATDTKQQIANIAAEIEELKATNIALQAELKEIKGTFETLLAKKNNLVAAQRKRR